MPSFSVPAEFQAIAQVGHALQFLEENGGTAVAKSHVVEALANRPNSPIANAVGNALLAEMRKHHMIGS